MAQTLAAADCEAKFFTGRRLRDPAAGLDGFDRALTSGFFRQDDLLAVVA